MQKLKILYLTTEDSTFWSHRLALAQAAREEGAEVVIMTRYGSHSKRLETDGFRVIPWRISRRSLNPFREIRSFIDVLLAYRRERPDLVHHIALKPIVFGSIASRLCGKIPTVNTVTGLGPIFTKDSFLFTAVRVLLKRLLTLSFRATNCKVIAQNQDDRKVLCGFGLQEIEKTAVITGFGIDTDEFCSLPEQPGDNIVTLPARMVWEKGIREFVEASKELKRRGVAARMVLAGEPDERNRGCIPKAQLERWSDSGTVEWWGQRGDMTAVLRQSRVVCLPSYCEGLPRTLVEAAACARAIVTTDVPGCSTVVRHGINGLLVPARDPIALADAIQVLLRDNKRRLAMGSAGREIAVREFSLEKILYATMGVYNQLLDGKWTFDRESCEQLKVTAKT